MDTIGLSCRAWSDEWLPGCRTTDLVALYADLNAEHFGGELPAIVPEYGGIPPECYGPRQGPPAAVFFSPEESDDGQSHIWVSEEFAECESPRGESLRGVLLHEMVHVATWERWGNRGGTHGKRFAAECNRIGRTQGWLEVFDEHHYDWDAYVDGTKGPAMWWPEDVREAS
jgi:hypothetical protein